MTSSSLAGGSAAGVVFVVILCAYVLQTELTQVRALFPLEAVIQCLSWGFSMSNQHYSTGNHICYCGSFSFLIKPLFTTFYFIATLHIRPLLWSFLYISYGSNGPQGTAYPTIRSRFGA